MDIQWYPGHMTKTRRMMTEDIKQVDAVCELLDARIPGSSRNPDLDGICGNKPRLIILNKADKADPSCSREWSAYFKKQGFSVLQTDSKSGSGIDKFPAAVRELLKDRLSAFALKGQTGRAVKTMIVGIPNVGKSTFINRIVNRKAAKAEDRPGVTRGKQWLKAEGGILLLDTPGILWPKFEDEKTGMHLAFTGAIRDDIMDIEELASKLFETLMQIAPDAVCSRYKIERRENIPGCELMEEAAKKRGFIISGGDADILRMAHVLLDEFRGGKLGRVTLELPDVDQ